jgi:integrase
LEVISPGVRLGYRRGRGTRGGGGTWLAATRTPTGKRLQARLGRADDATTADDAAVLSCEQAKDKARAWAKAVLAGKPDPAPGLTVDLILDRYLEVREAEGMKSIYDARSRAKTHIRPKLGEVLVSELTSERIRRWRDEMVKAPKRLRTKKLATLPKTRPVDLSDPEALRKRRDTANRTLTTLKAALNWAFEHRLAADDVAWRTVKPFRATTAARVRFLDADDQRKLLEKTTGALQDLVAAALVTGARFGELARLRVQDFDRGNASVFIAESKSGKARHIPLPAGGAKLFERLCEGRSPAVPLLAQDGGTAWKPMTYQRAFKGAVAAAGLPSITLHELRHSYASTMVRGGAPLIVVAQALGHSDTRMVERHYAHLERSYVNEIIRRLAPDFEAIGKIPE